MERVYEELDEAKAEIEKLRVEFKSKVELSENLKKLHNEQLIKIQEASLRIEKQAQEINEKAEEISTLKEVFEDLRRSLNEKESTIKHLSAANEKLRVDCDQKFKKWEDERNELLLALEEANGKNFDQEQQIYACKEEIKDLKGKLSVSQKKCLEAEKKAKITKKASEVEGVLLKLEEENGKIEEQLKWKKEQFTHLEEAHKKMRDEFKESKKEWELEKSLLIDEICSLQTSLDSKTRISEDLLSQWQMCNQALACEESRRRSLEVQLFDVQGEFNNVSNDYEDAKSQLECLTVKRDEEIASLRYSLGKKETILKEIEHQKRQMEQENQELQISLKELQESQIKNASGSPSVAKLRNKLKCLEHMQETANLKGKEAELNSQLEKMTQELSNYGLQLVCKDETIKELRMELEQMREDHTVILREKEAEWNSQVEKVTNKCLEHMQETANLKGKEAELNSQLEKMTQELSNYGLQLVCKDETIKELRMELEQMREDHTLILREKKAEWNSQVEKVTNDLNNCRSKFRSRDAITKEPGMELKQIDEDSAAKNQLKTMSGDLNKYKSQIDGKEEEDHSADLKAKEAERNSQLKKVTSDLNNYKSELQRRDDTIKELRMELEQVHGDSIAKFEAQEAERKYQLEMMTRDLNKHRSEIENRDEMIKELNMKLQKMHEDRLADLRDKEAERDSQLVKLTRDLNNCRSELESRDATIKALRMESEQAHGDFSANLKTKEVEWSYQLEMMIGDLNKYRSELVDKDARIKELEMDLEESHSSSLQLKLQNEEMSLTLLVLKDGISDAQLKIANEKAQMDRSNKVREQKISLLMQQLEIKSVDIGRLQKDIKKEQENAASLSRRVDSLNIIGQQQILMQKDLDRYEEMLMESSVCELFFREHILHMESVLNRKLKVVCDELDETNIELAEKISEGNEIEFELYIWKSVTEQLKAELEENYKIRKELEASLLAHVDFGETIKQEKQTLIHMLEEKEERIGNLQQQIALLEQNLTTREADANSRKMERAKVFELEKARFLQVIGEKDSILDQLQKEIGWLEQEPLRRELEELLFAKIEAERTIEHEKEKLMQLVVEHKIQRVNALMQLVESLEHKFNSSLISVTSQLAEKQEEIDLVLVAWEKITAAEIMATLEIEEKKLMIVELEDDICNVQQKLELQEKSTINLTQQALEIESNLEAKELEMKKLGDQLKTNLKNSDTLIEELKRENRVLVEDVTKLSLEREKLLGFVGGLDDRISEFSSTDKQLMIMLETLILSCDNHGSRMDVNSEDGHSRPAKENTDRPATMKKSEAIADGRSPFREINSEM